MAAAAAAVVGGPDLAILLSRMNFIAEAKPQQKLVFGKRQLSYVGAKDVIWNKLFRHLWNWQDATDNAHDILQTVQQGAEFLAHTPLDNQHFALVVDRMTRMKEGIHNLVQTHVENHEFGANLAIALVNIDTAVAMAAGRRRIALAGAVAVHNPPAAHHPSSGSTCLADINPNAVMMIPPPPLAPQPAPGPPPPPPPPPVDAVAP